MEKHEIAAARLKNQQITSPTETSPSEIVKWLGAIQAQDLPMALWAIGLRTFDSTHDSVREAFNKGEIIRTHLMRPTWHCVSADDIYWMLELTGPQIKTALNGRHKSLGITNGMLKKAKNIFIKHLEKNGPSSRTELVSLLENAGIPNEDNRAAHLLIHAELDAIICSGPLKGNKQTYALLEERVSNKKRLSYEEALSELAIRYFTSHGPATLDDFVWWSGLKKNQASLALELTKSQLHSATIHSKDYWFSQNQTFSQPDNESVFLLPAFDEFIISYRDRSAVIPSEHYKKAISRNGLFWPVIVVNGQVEGLWKRTIKRNSIDIATDFFQPVNQFVMSQTEKQKLALADFIGKEMNS